MREREKEDKIMLWENLAKYCQEVYGVFIDWEERFFICPECAEPIYEDDWSTDELGGCCPVCGTDWYDEEEEEEE